MRGDHARDATGGDQLADAETGQAGVIGDDGQIFLGRSDERVDQPVRRLPTPMKPPIITTAPSGMSAAAAAGEIAHFIAALPPTE